MNKKYIIRRVVVLIAAIGILFGGGAAAVSATERQMPDLTGVNYQEARNYYGNIMFFDEDNLKNRTVLSEKNWKICRQSTPAGATIRLLHVTTVYVVKTNEDCFGRNKPSTTSKQKTEPLSVRICKDLDTLSIYQVVNKYNTFLKDKGDGKAIAETLYGNVGLSCPEKLNDDSNGIYSFINSWAPEIFGSN